MVAHARRDGDRWIVLRDRGGVHHLRSAGAAICGYADELVETIMTPDRCAISCRACFDLVAIANGVRPAELTRELSLLTTPLEGA